MKTVWLILSIFSSATVYAQSVTSIKEKIVLSAEKCKTTIVELRGGQMKVDEGDTYIVQCSPTKTEFQLSCDFMDANYKVYNSVVLAGGINAGYAVIGNDDDKFILNLTSRIYMGESSLVVSNGLVRGKKICSGFFAFESELKNKK